MIKKYLAILTLILILALLVCMIPILSYKLFGPFEKPPVGKGGNCDQEHRFRYDTTIKSEDEFIQFLKLRQLEGDLPNFESTKDGLIPTNYGKKIIDLNKLKANVETEKSKAIFSNEKIYILRIKNQDFNETWPWMITIKCSESGHVSIRYCAGI